MKKAALFLTEGFEEGEALFTVDVIRRAGLVCDTFSLEGEMVTGSHGITVKADKILSPTIAKEDVIYSYDMLICPGGPGATALRDDERIISLYQEFAQNPSKYLAAICAAPMVLAKADVVKGKRVTSYPGEYKVLFPDSIYVEDQVSVTDGNVITSRGPATTLPFAYQLVEALGKDSEPLKEAMQYNFLMKYGK